MPKTFKDTPQAWELSFAKKRGNYWNVKATGDYDKDCALGGRLALEYLAFEEQDRGGPGLLQHIVADMPRDFTGVEVGFLTMVSWAAAAGAHRAREIAAYWDKTPNLREFAA